MPPSLQRRLDCAYETARDALVAEIGDGDHWIGELSTSALSTATAVAAFALVDWESKGESRFATLIRGGIEWLAQHQNADGGWGDTTRSLSNISTTMLARAAFELSQAAPDYPRSVDAAVQYLERAGGVEAVRARYGKDRTFAVPILTTSALAGLVNWREVAPLPFELACLPQSWFHRLNLPVVSYALPALIAVGQVRYARRPPRNPLTRFVRRMSIERSLRVLERIQPTSGGFLEAVPLTSFVTMSLAGAGQVGNPVARRAVQFLVESVRPDGSWPIDSNLSVWVTTLSTVALAAGADSTHAGCHAFTGASRGRHADGHAHPTLRRRESMAPVGKERPSRHAEPRWNEVRDWLLAHQYTRLHPYTNAAPGGWGWTHLPGGVPDADDTAGALLALAALPPSNESRRAARHGVDWLLALQNRDGGWPTFCRGWGHLPFDRSGSDLTAHALRALEVWKSLGSNGLSEESDGETAAARKRFNEKRESARSAGLRYLARHQRDDGSWLPLWFGNQYAPDDENPTYGTARVLAAYRDLGMLGCAPAQQGLAWLRAAQNRDGGWGGAPGIESSLEETALAVEALSADTGGDESGAALRAGVDWLADCIAAGGLQTPTPIGFYFAKLWYFEKLYPLIFSAAALGRARQAVVSGKPDVSWRESPAGV